MAEQSIETNPSTGLLFLDSSTESLIAKELLSRLKTPLTLIYTKTEKAPSLFLPDQAFPFEGIGHIRLAMAMMEAHGK